MPTKKKSLSSRLTDLGACRSAVDWAAKYTSAQKAWDECERADWMLWLLGTLSPVGSPSRRPLVACAAECAETSLPFIEDEETLAICLATLQMCYRWSIGDATDEELGEARDASYADAYADAYATAATSAATSAAYAATSARDPDLGGFLTTTATAYNKAMKDMSDIVRRHYPKAPSLTVPTLTENK